MKRRVARTDVGVVRLVLPLAVGYLVLAGSVSAAELAAGAAAALLAASFSAVLARRARVVLRPPARWAGAVAAALPEVASEAVLLAGALARQLAGGAKVAGTADEGHVRLRGVDATTAAIAVAVFPCITPNTLVRAVHPGGRVVGRRLLDVRRHALQDDVARLA